MASGRSNENLSPYQKTRPGLRPEDIGRPSEWRSRYGIEHETDLRRPASGVFSSSHSHEAAKLPQTQNVFARYSAQTLESSSHQSFSPIFRAGNTVPKSSSHPGGEYGKRDGADSVSPSYVPPHKRYGSGEGIEVQSSAQRLGSSYANRHTKRAHDELFSGANAKPDDFPRRGRGRGNHHKKVERAFSSDQKSHEYVPKLDVYQRSGRGRDFERGSFSAGGVSEQGIDGDHQMFPGSSYSRGRGKGRGSNHRRGGSSAVADASGGGEKGVRMERDKSWFQSVQSFSLGDIMSFSRLPPETLVNDLFTRIKGFQCTLQKTNTLDKPGIMLTIIKILSKVAGTMASSDGKASQILGEALSDRCAVFQFRLKVYILKELCGCTPSTDKYENIMSPHEKIHLLCGLFQSLLCSMPESSWSCLPVDELESAVQQQKSNYSAEALQDIIETVVALRNKAREQYSKQAKQKSRPKDGEWDNSEYRDVEILPQWNEVCVAQVPPRLRENIVSGGYKGGWLHYYDIQFRLLREDFVAPLRNGVCDYLNGVRGRKLKNVRVYKNVRIMEPVFQDSGICYKIKLDFSNMRRRCNWEHSKRLLYGSLLCLSTENDNFTDEIYFAIVTNRDPQSIAKGDLEVMFQGNESVLAFCSSNTSFIVVESCAYFEASQHILRSLQTAEVDTMPFKKYLILGDCNSVDQPEYLRESTGYNLSFLLTKDVKCTLLSVSPAKYKIPRESYAVYDSDSSDDESDGTVIQDCLVVPQIADIRSWPTCEQTELDNSQLMGLHMALTQEIAVIQGPPGTGKTYIGLKIVEALLNNKKVWNSGGTKSPILIMCFTNHALDQFLEGILDSPLYADTPGKLKLVRIGGRCKSEKLSQFSLRNLKHDVYLPGHVCERKHLTQDKVREFQSSISEYADLRGSNKLLSLQELVTYDIVQLNHHSALFNPLITRVQSSFALEIWLGLVDTQDSRFNAWTDPPITPDDAAGQSSTKLPQEVTNLDEEKEDSTSQNADAALIDIAGEASIEQAGRILDDVSDRVVKEVKFSHSSDYTHIMKSLKASVSWATSERFDRNGEIICYKNTSVQFNEAKAMQNLYSIFSAKPMSKLEHSRIRNILELPIQDRHRLYQYWHKQCLKHLRQECELEFVEYNRLCKEMDEARKEADRFTFETAEIIGMTTTGAAKYQHILHLVKPRIVIVEEAAEVIESHIVSALNAGTQHLILIGDHKQLRPKPNVYELATKKHLDVSLFERLIRNGFPRASLEIQHRMRPEIAELVKPHIYTTLSNDPSVEQYPDVRGVGTNLFFINHQFEEKEDENLVSHSNPHEANYLVSLCRYLLQQCYEHSQITILVTYSGQLLALRKLMPRHEFEGVRVSTVDNFQGEENDIILLSLVRSNSENSVGFLREENRVCVALSRARMGFYCIGNFTMLCDEVPIWNTIMTDMGTKGKLGDGLLLRCSNHPDISFVAKSSQDFVQKSPKGGCLKDCTFRLECGHVCAEKCHYTDPTHAEYQCTKNCTKSCEDGHPCRNLCCQPCKCKVRVKQLMPGCNHDQEMYCYQDPAKVDCTNPCSKKCPKGRHSCPLKCHEECKPCVVQVFVSMPKCGHQQWILCHEDAFSVSCIANCSRTCENGHPCPKLCYEACGDCSILVTKTIPECKHQIQLPCYVKPEHHKCTKPCERILPCSHACRLKCGEDCSLRDCEVKVTVELPDCGHQIAVSCHDSHLWAISCTERCTRKLPCGHNCGLKCGDPCETKCDVKVNKVWPCGHKLKRPCYQIVTPENYPCKSKCNAVLDCGHPCSRLCGEPCDKKCQVQVSKTYPCGHTVLAPCSSTPAQFSCKMLCSYILACGHKCSGKCADCTGKRVHASCTYKIGIKRVCGHLIQSQCGALTDSHPGRKEIAISCSHRTVNRACSGGDFHTCEEPCDWNCPHHQCQNLCHETCRRPVCDERCKKKLKCGHPCYGLCGEPCLSSCPKCYLRKFNKKLKSPGHFDAECIYYELPCMHIFSIEFLDYHVNAFTNPKSDMLVMPLQCPVKECFQLFSCSYRYGNHMKRVLSYVEEVNGIMQSPSTKSSVDNLVLRHRIKKVIDCGNMDVVSVEEYTNVLSKEQRKGWEYIRNESVYAKYTLMQEITLNIYNLKKGILLLHTEQMYLAFVFTEALSFLEAINGDDMLPTFTSTDDYEETLKEVKTFLKFLSPVATTSNQFKLPYQLIIDLQNQLLRLSLRISILLAKCSTNAAKSVLTDAETYLKSISVVTSKIVRSEFKTHIDAIGGLIPIGTIFNCQSLLKDMNHFHPIILKGKWWHCSRGHFYCSPPSVLEDITFNCPHCNLGSYEDFVQLPDQEKLCPAVSVAPIQEQVTDGNEIPAPIASQYFASGFDAQMEVGKRATQHLAWGGRGRRGRGGRRR